MLIKSVSKVDKLTQRVENFYDQKQRDEELSERQLARLNEIRKAPNWTITDFWCNYHKRDTTGMSYKVVFKSDGDYCSYYESINTGFPVLACCKGLRRHITDKQWDDYYRDSKMIQNQAKEAMANGDLLQPGMEGFITKYGDPNKKKYQQLEKEERANWTKKIMV